MKLFGLHLRKDGCWREVPQVPWDGAIYPIGYKPPTVLRLLFEWPWQKKDPLLRK
jgi:hypothetical protein